MRTKDVPQDPSFYRDAVRACYAVDESGRYVVAVSRGFEAETVATSVAVEAHERRREATRRLVLAGKASPLAWHMESRMMDAVLLARETGIWRWRVRRHLRPEVFARLSDAVLRRYADALDVDLAALRRVPADGEPGR